MWAGVRNPWCVIPASLDYKAETDWDDEDEVDTGKVVNQRVTTKLRPHTCLLRYKLADAGDDQGSWLRE